VTARKMERSEIPQVWDIDRSEIVHKIYYLAHGELALKTEYCDMKGWPAGEPEKYTPLLFECFDRGGWFYGIYDGTKLIAAVVLDCQAIGNDKNRLQLKFLHVSSAFRNRGIGKALFSAAVSEAARRGAKKIYISASPSEHTVKFYMKLGCTVADSPDPELQRLEPYDIHLEYIIDPVDRIGEDE
jgi:predicted N-acetyltransferase YhbS